MFSYSEANEPVNALRDSYIDKISLTTQPHEQSSSDTGMLQFMNLFNY